MLTLCWRQTIPWTVFLRWTSATGSVRDRPSFRCFLKATVVHPSQREEDRLTDDLWGKVYPEGRSTDSGINGDVSRRDQCSTASSPGQGHQAPGRSHVIQRAAHENPRAQEHQPRSTGLGPVYTKRQRQRWTISAMTLAILFSLKTMQLLQNGVATHFERLPSFQLEQYH